MTVKELISKLEQFDQNLDVVIFDFRKCSFCSEMSERAKGIYTIINESIDIETFYDNDAEMETEVLCLGFANSDYTNDFEVNYGSDLAIQIQKQLE